MQPNEEEKGRPIALSELRGSEEDLRSRQLVYRSLLLSLEAIGGPVSSPERFTSLKAIRRPVFLLSPTLCLRHFVDRFYLK